MQPAFLVSKRLTGVCEKDPTLVGRLRLANAATRVGNLTATTHPEQSYCDEGRRDPAPTRRRLDLLRPRRLLRFQFLLLGGGLTRSRLGHQILLAVEVGSVVKDSGRARLMRAEPVEARGLRRAQDAGPCGRRIPLDEKDWRLVRTHARRCVARRCHRATPSPRRAATAGSKPRAACSYAHRGGLRGCRPDDHD
jgi:hypothetical protein